MPTRKGWLLIIFSILVFLVGLKTKRIVLLSTAVILVSFLFAAWAAFVRPMGTLRFSRNLSNRIQEDEQIELNSTIYNINSWSLSWVELEDTVPIVPPENRALKHRFIRYLKRKSSICFSSRFNAFKRGIYALGPCIIRGGDPFGLFRTQKILLEYTRVMITPRMFDVSFFPLFRQRLLQRMVTTPVSSSGESHEFYAVREYRPQDGLRRIHWKSSAHRNELMVKEFEHLPAYQVSLLLDNRKEAAIGEGRETPLEYEVKIAASLIRYLTVHGNRCQLIFYRGGALHYTDFGDSEPHFEDMIQILTTVSWDYDGDLCDMVSESTAALTDGSFLLLFIARWQEEALPYILQLRSRDLQIIPVLFDHASFGYHVPPDWLDGVPIPGEDVLRSHGFSPITVRRGNNLADLFT